jgi:hypothetical protein
MPDIEIFRLERRRRDSDTEKVALLAEVDLRNPCQVTVRMHREKAFVGCRRIGTRDQRPSCRAFCFIGAPGEMTPMD